MRLSLRQTAGFETARHSSPYYLEHGRMTIGRAPDCTLQVEDPERAVSKLHCTIERVVDGFVLRDQSSAGTSVDGAMLSDGDTVRLASGSVIALCGFEFSVGISGEGAPDMADPGDSLRLSDEATTISSILADVAPAGHMASGLLPGSAFSGFIDISPPDPGESSSRNVTIGWEGPPGVDNMDNVSLPADWNDPSSLSTELEHRIATNTVVQVKASAVAPAQGDAPATAPPPDPDVIRLVEASVPDATTAFRKHRLITIVREEDSEAAAEEAPPAPDAPPAPEAPPVLGSLLVPEAPPAVEEVDQPVVAVDSGDVELHVDELLLSVDEPLVELAQRVTVLERLFADSLAKYDVEIPPGERASTGSVRGASAAEIAARLDMLIDRHTRLFSAMDNFLEQIRSMEPAAVEARVTLGEAGSNGFRTPGWFLQLPLLADSVYWRCFKSGFHRGSKGSVLEFFGEALRDRFEGAAAPGTSNEFEESKVNEG